VRRLIVRAPPSHAMMATTWTSLRSAYVFTKSLSQAGAAWNRGPLEREHYTRYLKNVKYW
jgi:hypothetical protein